MEKELVRICLKDGSSILGYVPSLDDIFQDLNCSKFIMYTNKSTGKHEIVNTDGIKFIRISSKDEKSE